MGFRQVCDLCFFCVASTWMSLAGDPPRDESRCDGGSDDCAAVDRCGPGSCNAPQRAAVRRSTEPEACHQGRGKGGVRLRSMGTEDSTSGGAAGCGSHGGLRGCREASHHAAARCHWRGRCPTGVEGGGREAGTGGDGKTSVGRLGGMAEEEKEKQEEAKKEGPEILFLSFLKLLLDVCVSPEEYESSGFFWETTSCVLLRSTFLDICIWQSLRQCACVSPRLLEEIHTASPDLRRSPVPCPGCLWSTCLGLGRGLRKMLRILYAWFVGHGDFCLIALFARGNWTLLFGPLVTSTHLFSTRRLRST